MPFEIVRNDIADMQVDAIVNTANPKPVIGSGVDSRIHQRAGAQLLEARRTIGCIPFGEAAITPAFGLNASYVIHAVGPVWRDGCHGEEHCLRACYRRALELAWQYHCKSVAFPLISTGNYEFPKPLALQIAVREFSAFLMEHEMKIFLVVFDQESLSLSERLVQSVSSYIDDRYVEESAVFESRMGEDSARAEQEYGWKVPAASIAKEDWRKILQKLDVGFSETLLQLIDRSGKKDSEIYKRANVDRKLFSKIRTNRDYRPSKQTALVFAFALELTLEETRDFIGRAGFALSHSSKFDVIVEYFLVNRRYDIWEVNEILFQFDQPLIGA